MKQFVKIIKLVMYRLKKLLFILMLPLTTLGFSQEELKLPSEIYGIWRSIDNEFVSIYTNSEFVTVFDRRSPGGQRLAYGTINYKNGEMCINRLDTPDEYSLAFIVGESTLVITKPRSTQAWLWTKIQ